MKINNIVRFGLVVLTFVMMIALLGATLMGSTTAVAQGPTATPDDPVWLAFDAARTALEDELQQQIRFVQSYTFAETEFDGGISACQTLEEGEQEEFLFFGWRFIITLLDGTQYEVRTSFNYQIVVICDEVTIVQAAEPAEVDPNLPDAVVAPVGPGGLEVGGQVNRIDTALAALNSSRMGWVKIQVNPSVTFDTADAFIREAQANNLKILLSVVGDISRAADPDYHIEFATFLGQLALAGADAIEVWNEPNIEREWPVGQISGANYTQMLATAYNAIKSNNAGTLVISGAPAPTGAAGSAGCTDQLCNDDVFYQQMAAAGAANFMDCVGVHYNEGVVSPLQTTGDPRDNYGTRYYATNLGRALGPFPGKQACITEIGYLSGEGFSQPIPANFAWANNTTVAQHAQWLGEAVGKARTDGNVRLLIVFNVNFSTFTDDPQGGYAMIRPDGSCPACSAIAGALN